MAKGGIRFENIDPKIAAYTGAGTRINGAVNRTLRRVAPIAVAFLKAETPVGATKGLRNSTAGSIVGGPVGQRLEIRQGVKSREGDPYGRFVREGTRPHFPPVAALVPWVQKVFGVSESAAISIAYQVARKISRVGTKPNPYHARALKSMMPQLRVIFKQEAVTLAATLSR